MYGSGRGLHKPERPIRNMAQVEVGVAKGVDGGCHYGDADNVEYGAGFDLHTNCERAVGCARVLISV